MAKGKKGTRASGSRSGAGGEAGGAGFAMMEVDPRRVRFAHSRIKPIFSGCGRTIEQTLDEIRAGKTAPSDLPKITVILGPVDKQDGQQWFFSLNNRRLFVFKVCREEGLLGPSGLVLVRARPMKDHERERYTVERCALQARFLYTPAAAADPPETNGDEEARTTGVPPRSSSDARDGAGSEERWGDSDG